MVENLSSIVEYIPYIEAVGVFLNGMKYIKKYSLKIIDNYCSYSRDINEVFNEVEQGNRNIGDYVTIEGYLLKYGQVFNPYTYVNGVWGPTSPEEVEEFNLIHKGTEHELRNGEILFGKRDFILPVQKLNNYSNIGCAFIYDTRFKGFSTDVNDKFSMPILVIYDINKHGKYLNKKVIIKGKIMEVPLDICKDLNGIYDDNIRKICSNFYRPYNEDINMICISLIGEKVKIDYSNNYMLTDNFDNFDIPLFIEGDLKKFYDMDNKRVVETINHIMPNTYDKYLKTGINFPLSLHGEGDKGITIPTTDDIQVTYKDKGKIGFYTKTSLIERDKYGKNLDEFLRYIQNFSIDYRNFCAKEFKEKDSLDISFMFDSTKRNLFKSKAIKSKFDNFEDINKKHEEIVKWYNPN
ncbi:MAG: hypothetical protein ACLS9F_00010 [Clostridium paraputrificum]